MKIYLDEGDTLTPDELPEIVKFIKKYGNHKNDLLDLGSMLIAAEIVENRKEEGEPPREQRFPVTPGTGIHTADCAKYWWSPTKAPSCTCGVSVSR